MNDLLSECMADLKTKDQAAFTATFCERCRQTGCHRAKWAGDKFGARVANQVNRLFHTERADPTSSRYEGLLDFKDMFTEAMRQEIADQRGDWNIPQIPDFSKKIPDISKPNPSRMPKHMAAYAMPEDVPGMVMDEDTPTSEPDPIQMPNPVVPEGTPATTVVAPKVGAINVKTGNTHVPAGGIMLGDPKIPPKPVHDPWAAPSQVPTVPVVKSGATIKMGGDK